MWNLQNRFKEVIPVIMFQFQLTFRKIPWNKFQTKCKLIHFFTMKDRIPVFLRSGFAYKFKWGGCNACYYGKTKHHFKVRISSLTRKRVKGGNCSAIKENQLFCNHSSGFYDFSILASNTNDFKVTLIESPLINRHSLPFATFWWLRNIILSHNSQRLI